MRAIVGDDDTCMRRPRYMDSSLRRQLDDDDNDDDGAAKFQLLSTQRRFGRQHRHHHRRSPREMRSDMKFVDLCSLSARSTDNGRVRLAPHALLGQKQNENHFDREDAEVDEAHNRIQ